MSTFPENLRAGDRVRLVKPFRYFDDDPDDDETYDEDLRAYTPHGSDVFGTVMKVDWADDGSGTGKKRQEILVRFDTTVEGERQIINQLWTDADVLAPELDPPSDDEVQAAIQSILGGTA